MVDFTCVEFIKQLDHDLRNRIATVLNQLYLNTPSDQIKNELGEMLGLLPPFFLIEQELAEGRVSKEFSIIDMSQGEASWIFQNINEVLLPCNLKYLGWQDCTNEKLRSPTECGEVLDFNNVILKFGPPTRSVFDHSYCSCRSFTDLCKHFPIPLKKCIKLDFVLTAFKLRVEIVLDGALAGTASLTGCVDCEE